VLDAPAAARVVYPDQAKDVRTAKAIIKIAEQIFAESVHRYLSTASKQATGDY